PVFHFSRLFSPLRPPPPSTLFPYTTLFRSVLTILLTSCYGFGCARHRDEPKAETATLNVTHWTEQSELYMEYPPLVAGQPALLRSEEHTSELQSPCNLVCRLLLEKKKKKIN